MAGAAIAVACASGRCRPRGRFTISCSCHGAFVDQTSWQPVAEILEEEGLHCDARGKPAHVAGRRRRRHQTGAGEAGRQDDSRRPLLGRRGHHRSRQRSQGLGAGLRLRLRARRWQIARPPSPRPVRPPKAPARFMPTQRATSPSIPRCFRSAVAADLPPKIAESAGEWAAAAEPHGVRGEGRYSGLARQADLLCDQHQGQGDRPRGPEDVRRPDQGADDGGRAAATPPSSSMRPKSPRSSRRRRSRSDDQAPGAFAPGAPRVHRALSVARVIFSPGRSRG